MKSVYQMKQLRERAETILAMRAKEDNTKLSYNEARKIIHDLNLHQIELDLQNENLREALVEIEESRNKYANLYNLIPFGYYTLNEKGVIQEVNDEGSNLIGVKKERLLSQTLVRYIAPNFQYAFLEHCRKTLESMDIQSCEVKLINRSAGLFDVRVDTKPILNRANAEKSLLMAITNLQLEKDQEAVSHRNQHKMSATERHMSLEKLSAVIAHELNSPLAITANYLHGCIHRLEAGDFQIPDIIKALKKAAEQYHRASEIILRMKDFSCKGMLHKEPHDVNYLVQETMHYIKYEALDFPVTLKFLRGNKLPLANIDKIHIQQAILNLARNAIESMRDANSVNASLTIEVNHKDMKTIEICIIDNGPGVPDNVLYKLFNHNFTTKSYGIGLGLCISRSIVEAHGGSINVEPSLTRGACFKFTLPI